MAGTLEGGKAAAKTNRQKYGKGFYGRIGAMGGKKKVSKGFGVNHDMAREAGKLGGKVSKRGHKFLGFDEYGAPQYMKEPKR